MSVQESKNGLCNKPCLNGRQAQALRAIPTCCDSHVLFTSRCLHTILTSAAHGNGFAEFSSGYAHFSKSHLVQQGQCFTLSHGDKQLLQVRLWEHTSRSGASMSSSTFLHPINPPLSAPTSKARQTAGCRGGVEVSSNQKGQLLHFCYVKQLCSAPPALCCWEPSLPALSPQSQPPHKAGRQKPPSTQETLQAEYFFTEVFPQVSGLNGMFWAV